MMTLTQNPVFLCFLFILQPKMTKKEIKKLGHKQIKRWMTWEWSRTNYDDLFYRMTMTIAKVRRKTQFA